MKLSEVIKILHDHNEWYRDGEGEMVNPTVIGEVIDSAIRRLKRYEKLMAFLKTEQVSDIPVTDDVVEAVAFAIAKADGEIDRNILGFEEHILNEYRPHAKASIEAYEQRNMATARRHAPLWITWLVCALGMSIIFNMALLVAHHG